jgi:hypothetical protein
MTVRGGIPADLSDGVGKVYNSAECKPIQIAESSVMDGCEDHYIAQCQFWFYKWFPRKMEFVPDGVLGGYGHGTGVVQSTWRVLPMT